MNWLTWLFPAKSATSPTPVTSVPTRAPESAAVPLMRAPSPVDWHAVIKAVAPQGHASIVDGLADSMPGLIAKFDLTTPLRQAYFIGEWAEETAGYTTLTEFASGRAYEGRRDLGNIHPGDGVRFKGRGLPMLTGRDNYARLGRQLAVDFVSNPDLVATFPHAANVAGVFWRERNINHPADRDDIREVTRLINGGENGIGTRAIYLRRAKLALRGA
jgi:putative chitinase